MKAAPAAPDVVFHKVAAAVAAAGGGGGGSGPAGSGSGAPKPAVSGTKRAAGPVVAAVPSAGGSHGLGGGPSGGGSSGSGGKPAASFRQRVLARQRVTGTFLSLGSSVSAEFASQAGFDYVLIDNEHGLGGEAALLHQLQAVKGGTKSIVRTNGSDPRQILRVRPGAAPQLRTLPRA